MYRIALLLSLLISLDLPGQCPPSFFVIKRQGQIDSFAILFPGCTNIEHGLGIGTTNIKNLHGLSHITSILGRLAITNTDLTSLNGLESLEKIDQFEIIQNHKLENLNGFNVDSISWLHLSMNATTNLDALSGVQFISLLTIESMAIQNLNAFSHLHDYDHIQLLNLSNLPNLNGLPQLPSSQHYRKINISDCGALTSLQGLGTGIADLVLSSNPMLADVSALNNMADLYSLLCVDNNGITQIGLQNLTQLGILRLVSNNNLKRLDGPETITKMYNFELLGNPMLTILNGFRNVHTLHYVHIKNMPLTHLDPFESLDTVYRDLVIDYNFQLGDISGLLGIRYIGRDLILDYTTINSLSGLDSLNFIGSHFQLTTNSKLPTLEGLESLTYVGTSLVINGILKIQNLEGLGALQECGSLQLFNLQALQSLEGLESLDSINKSLDISYNPMLADASSISDLKFIGGNFLLNQNGSLSSIPVFENLNTIYGSVSITNNASLQSVATFQNLNYLNGGLTIAGNGMLSSLVGFDNIYWWSVSNFILYDNPSLMMCVTPGICQYLAQEWKPRTISNNGSGCQSSEEIEELCGPLSTNGLNEKSIVLYPNPATNSVNLTTDLVINNITIYDVSGVPLIKMKHPNDEIDISLYPAGIYFIQIEMDGGVVMKRMIKN